MSDVKIKFSSDTKNFNDGVKNVNSSIAGLKNNALSFSKMGALALGGAAVFGLAKGFSSLGSAISDSVKKAADFETLNISLEVLTGSATTASKLLAEIVDYGATTPLEGGDIQKATETLLGFGVALEEVMPITKMLGDVSKGNGQKLSSLALVYGQVSSAGRLMGGDVLQMINSGFNPLNNISKKLGLTMIDTKKKMEDGEISIDMLKQAFVDATSSGGLFNGMLAKMGNTFTGKLSNLKDNLSQIQIAFGTGLNKGLITVLDNINELLPKFKDFASSSGKLMGDIITNLVNAFNDGKITDAISSAFTIALKNYGATYVSFFIFLAKLFAKTVKEELTPKSLRKDPNVLPSYDPQNPHPNTKTFEHYLSLLMGPMTGIPAYVYASNRRDQEADLKITNPSGPRDEFRSIKKEVSKWNLFNMSNNIDDFWNAGGGKPQPKVESVMGSTTPEEWKSLIDAAMLASNKAANEAKEKAAFTDSIKNLMFGNGVSDFTASLFDEVLPGVKRIKKDDNPFQLSGYQPVVKSLSKIGGGGLSKLGSGFGDPLVDLQKQTINQLKQIVKNTSKQTGNGVAVFGGN